MHWMNVMVLVHLLVVSWGDVNPGINTIVPCEPGELVFIDCNLCTCNREGFPNQMCARMWCPPPPKTLMTPPPAPPPEINEVDVDHDLGSGAGASYIRLCAVELFYSETLRLVEAMRKHRSPSPPTTAVN